MSHSSGIPGIIFHIFLCGLMNVKRKGGGVVVVGLGERCRRRKMKGIMSQYILVREE